MKLTVYQLLGENCMTQQAGQQLYGEVAPLLKVGQAVELDFMGVKRFLSVFFNFAIGQLLRDLRADDLERLLSVTHLSPIGQQTYERVLENAQHYYSHPEYRQAVDALVQEQSVCL
jgi:hypothetical protein